MQKKYILLIAFSIGGMITYAQNTAVIYNVKDFVAITDGTTLIPGLIIGLLILSLQKEDFNRVKWPLGKGAYNFQLKNVTDLTLHNFQLLHYTTIKKNSGAAFIDQQLL